MSPTRNYLEAWFNDLCASPLAPVPEQYKPWDGQLLQFDRIFDREEWDHRTLAGAVGNHNVRSSLDHLSSQGCFFFKKK